jgi:hypothetical protein
MIGRKIVMLFCFIAFYISDARCDSIDFWHIYYNNTKILGCDQNSNCLLNLKKDSMKDNDTITLMYFTDTGCQQEQTLSLEDSTGHVFCTSAPCEGYESAHRLIIPVSFLKAALIINKRANFQIFSRSLNNPPIEIVKFDID